MKYEEITGNIIKAAFKVHNTLGYGLQEKHYQKALMIEVMKSAYEVNMEYYTPLYYETHVIGQGRVDLFVDKKVMVELKTLKELSIADEIQLVSYLNASRIEVGLLINFGQTVTIKRKFRDYLPPEN